MITLYEKIIAEYPELADRDDIFFKGAIRLENHGNGDFIAKWEYEKPIPEGLKLGK